MTLSSMKDLYTGDATQTSKPWAIALFFISSLICAEFAIKYGHYLSYSRYENKSF